MPVRLRHYPRPIATLGLLIVFCLFALSCSAGALPQSQPRTITSGQATVEADDDWVVPSTSTDQTADSEGSETAADQSEDPTDETAVTERPEATANQTGEQAEEPADQAEDPTGETTTTQEADDQGEDSADPTGADTDQAEESTSTDRITIDASSTGLPIDRRLLGTNLPAWIRPSILSDQNFQRGVLDSGTTLIRMPGGSWSNVYDWYGCELADPENCFWTWAARPTDFINFLSATGLDGMWTVSINDTAQKSAAAVAFFNGSVDDTSIIGVDRLGVDWGLVRDWAQLRAANGNPDPVGISLWEVGNEVYGGRPANGGAQCASFGWEEVWTCDGTEYALGTNDHDGALAIRTAMRAVDPTIEVGLVGVTDPSSWSDWGDEVIDAAGGSLDMYIVHQYGFDGSPDPQQALRRPAELWPAVIAAARSNLPANATLALTEFNLVSFESGDTAQSMTRAVNAFFLADSIGQLAVGQVAIANWWNLGNGITSSGTDYGLISVTEGAGYRRSPAFEAFAMWGKTGTTLLDVASQVDDLRVYPTRHADGRLAIIAINLGAVRIETDLVIEGLDGAADLEATVDTVTANDLSAQELIVAPTLSLGPPDEPISLVMAPWSMLLIEVQAPS